MKNFEPVIVKYKNKGVSLDNIEYAVDAVKCGTKRSHILENLTADYRGMNTSEATTLLEELFVVNGGEFKKENRHGYLYGVFFLMVGLPCAFYIFYVFTYGGVIVRPVIVFAVAIGGTLSGLFLIIKSIRGKYRDSDQPFAD